ncbi:MAG TPA: amidohydrolase family protein [Chthoniobacterales bacterium]|nr:amidohydrolase family protein [Chthoniobacterales bacterium]
MKAFLAFLKIDLKLARRNRAVLFFNYLFPLIFFFAFGFAFGRFGSGILLVVTMVTTIGILGTGFFGAGMRAVQEREENILRRYKVTPITPVPLLCASVAMGVILYIPTVGLMLFLAHNIFGMAYPGNWGSLLLFVCLGVAAFRAFGLIIAAVVNTSQEGNILIQIIYMPMLFLSGASFPLAFMPDWLKLVTQFIPATYLVTGMSGILQRGESIMQNLPSVFALIVTMLVALFIATKLFRWEKEEKLRPSAKLWVLAVLLPFFLLGSYQVWSRQELTKARILDRERARGHTWLIRNARIFVGNGKVIESGAILIRHGKIEEIYEGNIPDPKSLNADAIEAAGKTILPGLIDVHVHLGASGGFPEDMTKMDPAKTSERALEAYLYCGTTAVRSAGDRLDSMLKLRGRFGTGEKLGTELLFCGPLFTAEGGHGTEYARFMPEAMRAEFNAQFVRTPKNAEEARKQVNDLAGQHVDAIKGVLEAGVPGYSFNRMDVEVLRSVVEEAHAKQLPVAIHTGNARDVGDAVLLGADSIEHGSFIDEIPDATIAEMKAKNIAYDPTLSVVEGFSNFSKGDTTLLQRSLVQQVTQKDLLNGTAKAATSDQFKGLREGLQHYPMSMEIGGRNLLKAWQAGVLLVTGSDAGNFLVMHGPTVQHEIELWVAAGIPVEVALQAATSNAAKLLRTDSRIGTVEKGKEATLLMVDGDPLRDVRVLSSISAVFLKGERVNRAELFEQR